jgi:hypothetical protein
MELTRGNRNIPETYRVTRGEIRVGDSCYKPGDEFSADIFFPGIRRIRLRQYYERRMIIPVPVPSSEVQIPALQAPTREDTPVIGGLPVDLDIEVPVTVETTSPEPARGYMPRRKSKGDS